MISSPLTEWMDLLSKENGFEKLEPDDNGVWRLACDETPLMITPLDGNQVLFEALLPAPPAEVLGKVARAALIGNYLFEQTEGALFALDAQTNGIVLRESAAPVGAEEFALALEQFVGKAERWQMLLGRYTELMLSGGLPEKGEAGTETGETAAGLGIPSTWLAI